MKKIILVSTLVIGFVIFFFPSEQEISFYQFNTKNINTEEEGAIVCSLTSLELVERKEQLRELVLSKVKTIEEQDDGFLLTFEDQEEMTKILFDFILKEKDCCPFIRYDILITPYGNGIYLKISGGKLVKPFLKIMLEEF